MYEIERRMRNGSVNQIKGKNWLNCFEREGGCGHKGRFVSVGRMKRKRRDVKGRNKEKDPTSYLVCLWRKWRRKGVKKGVGYSSLFHPLNPSLTFHTYHSIWNIWLIRMRERERSQEEEYEERRASYRYEERKRHKSHVYPPPLLL